MNKVLYLQKVEEAENDKGNLDFDKSTLSVWNCNGK